MLYFALYLAASFRSGLRPRSDVYGESYSCYLLQPLLGKSMSTRDPLSYIRPLADVFFFPGKDPAAPVATCSIGLAPSNCPLACPVSTWSSSRADSPPSRCHFVRLAHASSLSLVRSSYLCPLSSLPRIMFSFAYLSGESTASRFAVFSISHSLNVCFRHSFHRHISRPPDLYQLDFLPLLVVLLLKLLDTRVVTKVEVIEEAGHDCLSRVLQHEVKGKCSCIFFQSVYSSTSADVWMVKRSTCDGYRPAQLEPVGKSNVCHRGCLVVVDFREGPSLPCTSFARPRALLAGVYPRPPAMPPALL